MRALAFFLLTILGILGCAAQNLTLKSALYPPLFKAAAATLTITNDLVLWLKADAATNLVDNTDLVYWPDSSTNNKPASAPSNWPKFLLNQRGALPGIDFNGTSHALVGATPTVSNTCSMFMVIRWDSTNALRCAFRVGETTGFGLMNTATGQREVLHRAVADCVDENTGTTAELWSTVRTPVPLEQIWVNGTAKTLSNSGSACNGPDGGGYFVGYFGAAGFFTDGQIYEILLYSTPLSDANRQSVEAYLKSKWGL